MIEQTVENTGRLMKKSDIEKIMKFNQVFSNLSFVICHWLWKKVMFIYLWILTNDK
jgi:hypothetical protein